MEDEREKAGRGGGGEADADAHAHAHDHAHAHAHDHAHADDHDHAPDDGHGHGHGHGHGPEPEPGGGANEKRQARRLLLVLLVIGAFFFVELIGAKAARSDVLEADAYHLLMDVFALGISLGAMKIATTRPSPRFTYGLRRVEPLAAILNGALVFGVAVELVRDAVEHLAKPEMPRSGIMLIVASAALVVNAFSAWVLHGAMHGGHAGHGHGHDHDHDGAGVDEDEGRHATAHAHHLNLRGAWLHLLGDALGSVAAFVAGVAIRYGASPVVDPIASFLVVAILVVGALRLVRDAGLVLLDAAPPRLPVVRVRKMVLGYPGIKAIHALHVWSLGTGHDAVTVHVISDGVDPDLATRLGDALRTRFDAEYVTVQVERAAAADAANPSAAPSRPT